MPAFTYPIGLLKPKKDPTFKFTIVTTGASETFTLPTVSGETYNAIVNYGDGGGDKTVTVFNDPDITNTYAIAGTYQISITGKFGGFTFNNGGDKLKVISVDQAGNVGFENIGAMWYGCSNMTSCNLLGLDLSLTSTSTLSSFIRNCSVLTSIVTDDWDVSSMQDTSNFARSCVVLNNLDVSNWDTSSFTTLSSFIQNCQALVTCDVSGWDVGNVTTFVSFAQSCILLANCDISGWDMSSAVNITGLLFACFVLVTVNTNSWDTSAITNCTNAFRQMTACTSSFTNTLWWNRTIPIATFANCFTASFSISNYASIPNNWKGL